MMAWLLTLSYFFTNELRLFAGLFLVSRVTGFQPRRAAMLLAGVGGVLVTALQTVSHSTIGPLAVANAADKDATVLAAVSAIDKARAKGVIKKNPASRKISRMAKRANKNA